MKLSEAEASASIFYVWRGANLESEVPVATRSSVSPPRCYALSPKLNNFERISTVAGGKTRKIVNATHT